MSTPKLTVLLIDDEPMCLKILKEFLQILPLEISFNTIECQTIEEAKGKIEQVDINIIISDCEVGKDNGIVFLQDLLNRTNAYLVAMSGNPSYRKEAAEIGIDFLEKPFSLSAVLRTVQSYLLQTKT